MHYYQFNIDDFDSATSYLTHVEHSLYRRAIDLYYKTESPLNLDIKKLERRFRANTSEEKEALSFVLEEFFYKTDEGFANERCEEVLAEYRFTKNEKSIAGQISATSKKINKLKAESIANIKQLMASKNKTEAQQVLNDCLTSVERVLSKCSTEVQQRFNTKATHSQLTKELNNLITKELNNNDKQEKSGADAPAHSKDEKFDFKKSLIDLGVDKSVAVDWMAVRKTKRATNTKTAFKKIEREIVKSGMTANDAAILAVEKSWAGFDSTWAGSSVGEAVKIDVSKLGNEELLKMAQDLSISTQGLFRPDLISAIQGKIQ